MGSTALVVLQKSQSTFRSMLSVLEVTDELHFILEAI